MPPAAAAPIRGTADEDDLDFTIFIHMMRKLLKKRDVGAFNQ
jgi:hypothetical protein